MKNIDYDWQQIILTLIGKFDIQTISDRCEISIDDVNKIKLGYVLEPCFSADCLLLDSFQCHFPSKVDEVIL